MPASNTGKQLAYQITPIFLVGGSVSNVLPSMFPIANLFGPSSTPLKLPYDINDLDDAFAAFNVVPGGQLILQQIGKYPFANQSVAANAVIREPLTLSVLMDTPMRGKNSWALKQQIFTQLKAKLEQHNNAGGSYVVATPAYIYENLILTALTDISRAQNTVPQNAWRWDFEQPLFTRQGLNGALNNLASNLNLGIKTTGAITGIKVGAQSAQPHQMLGTYKVEGALTGGPPSKSTNPPISQDAFNYPATPRISGFELGGVS